MARRTGRMLWWEDTRERFQGAELGGIKESGIDFFVAQKEGTSKCHAG